MKVADKINYLLTEKNMSKKIFVQKLLALEPILERTGKSPNESTVYAYLNGGREIKIELIPYIAEVLDICEQELFTDEIEFSNYYNVRFSRDAREILNLLQYAPQNAVEDIKQYLLKYKKIYEKGI